MHKHTIQSNKNSKSHYAARKLEAVQAKGFGICENYEKHYSQMHIQNIFEYIPAYASR